MPSRQELHDLFGLDGVDKTASAREDVRRLLDDVEKTAQITETSGDPMSTTLHDLLNQTDTMQKQAAAQAARSELEKTAEELAIADMAFEKIAAVHGCHKSVIESIAIKLAGVPLTKEARDQLALEYDAGGRFMARGFHDESIKLAAEWDHQVKRAMHEGAVAGQIENDHNATRAPIPTTGATPKAENADISQGAATLTEAGKLTEVDTRLPGGSLGQTFTVRDALGLPDIASGATAAAPS
jgi:hypothetical protein